MQRQCKPTVDVEQQIWNIYNGCSEMDKYTHIDDIYTFISDQVQRLQIVISKQEFLAFMTRWHSYSMVERHSENEYPYYIPGMYYVAHAKF
jgi:hypothetical protein